MARAWLPMKDQELLPFVTNFSSKITATPTTYGLTAPEATSLASALSSFNTALGLASDPATRTQVTVTNKDVAKATLVAMVRSYARRIQANTAVTAGQKEALGLPIHKLTPTPIPAPVTRPILTLEGPPTGLTVPIRLVDESTPTKKAKPFGVDGAAVYSYIAKSGEEPPADLELWRFEGITKRSSFEIGYGSGDVGKTAVIRAHWFNPRGLPGPASAPVTATIAA